MVLPEKCMHHCHDTGFSPFIDSYKRGQSFGFTKVCKVPLSNQIWIQVADPDSQSQQFMACLVCAAIDCKRKSAVLVAHQFFVAIQWMDPIYASCSEIPLCFAFFSNGASSRKTFRVEFSNSLIMDEVISQWGNSIWSHARTLIPNEKPEENHMIFLCVFIGHQDSCMQITEITHSTTQQMQLLMILTLALLELS